MVFYIFYKSAHNVAVEEIVIEETVIICLQHNNDFKILTRILRAQYKMVLQELYTK